MTTMSRGLRQSAPKKGAPGDQVWDLLCAVLDSYMEGGQLFWMMPLHLHVNQKHDDDGLGLPAPRLPSICISYAVLIAPLERATCPNQRSLLSLKMRSRSSSWSFASSSLDLTLATSSGLILQICLIMALSLRCKRCRFVLVSGQVSLAWNMALRTQELYTWPRVL